MKEFVNTDLLLSSVRRCAQNYNMIDDGDVIAVGISGGKDSAALLCALALMRRFYPKKYDLKAITVDIGLADMDFTPIERLCRDLDVEYIKTDTEIAEIVFNRKNDGCSLCSRMRRGALHSEAQKLGCNKVALGHTKDDVAETLIMNILYSGKIEVFWPKNTPDGREMTLIRPLIYTSEKIIKTFCEKNDIPIVKNTCPYDSNTVRRTVEELIKDADKVSRGVTHRIFRAIEKSGIDGFENFD